MHRRALGKLKEAARALYSQPVKSNPKNGFDLGYLYASQDAEVFPENWAAIELFLKLGTQWNVSANGRTGLNYLTLFALLDRSGLSKEDAALMFDDIRVLEYAALEEMNKETS